MPDLFAQDPPRYVVEKDWAGWWRTPYRFHTQAEADAAAIRLADENPGRRFRGVPLP